MKANHSLFFILVILFTVGNAYIIDSNNYLYINSSFNRHTASYSMCFHFNDSATV